MSDRIPTTREIVEHANSLELTPADEGFKAARNENNERIEGLILSSDLKKLEFTIDNIVKDLSLHGLEIDEIAEYLQSKVADITNNTFIEE